MKKLLLPILLLTLSLTACNLPALFQASPTSTPASTPTSTPLPSPTIAPTSTPTSIPTSTPTPVPAVRIAKADRALFNGDYQAALGEYAAADSNSTDPEILSAALLGQGRIHYLNGVYLDALNEFRAILNNYPTSSQVVPAHYFLGETLMQLDRFPEAAEAFANYVELPSRRCGCFHLRAPGRCVCGKWRVEFSHHCLYNGCSITPPAHRFLARAQAGADLRAHG